MRKVIEANGVWGVAQDTLEIQILGGKEIDYQLHQDLQHKPHEAGNHFRRDAKGKIVKRPKKSED